MRRTLDGSIRKAVALGVVALVALAAALPVAPASAQPSQEGYALKIFRVDSVLYPFVQVYFRTFDQNKQPLVNLNEMNVGLMVDGRSYDPTKQQYRLASIRDREQSIRSILVIDASASMAGKPFEAALRAAVSFIASKRPNDQVAVLAVRDTPEGYELVSGFDRDGQALVRRLADLKADGKKSRLYDTIAAAMQMAAMPPQGGGGDKDYIVSTAIVVLSDGKDEGSALSRSDLNTRITSLALPIPIYSVAYTKVSTDNFRNLEALSKNSFGAYYEAGTALERMQQMVDQIQNILQGDYVLTFLSYVKPDGNEHNLKLGIEYPSRSGRMTYESAKFEAVEAPPLPAIQAKLVEMRKVIPVLPNGNPYYERQPEAPAKTP